MSLPQSKPVCKIKLPAMEQITGPLQPFVQFMFSQNQIKKSAFLIFFPQHPHSLCLQLASCLSLPRRGADFNRYD